MQLSQIPARIRLAFASSGTKNTIPVNSVAPTGLASYTDGFPPLTFIDPNAGGIPPDGADFNGILNAITAIDKWSSAGGGYTYDSSFANDPLVNGYPKGARVLRSDGLGYWLNIADNNTTNPESGGSNWVPDYTYGINAVTMTGSNVTLTALQYGQPMISISGTLSANVQLIFPDGISGQWIIFNSAVMGNFTITAKTASGTGITLVSGANIVLSNAVNIFSTLISAFTGASNQSLAGSGWQRFPGGLIQQWGSASITAPSGTVTFPLTFPNVCYQVIVCDLSESGSLYYWGSENLLTNQFTARTSIPSGPDGLRYFAIGR